MSKVAEAAWAAQRADEDARAAAERKRAVEASRKAASERRARIKKHRHLLDESVLPIIFPNTKWSIIEVYVQGVGKDAKPTLVVREKGADNTWDPEFRINLDGVFIDYTHRSWTYGTERSQPAAYPIKTALDVGQYLKLMSDQMDEAYRRNPD